MCTVAIYTSEESFIFMTYFNQERMAESVGHSDARIKSELLHPANNNNSKYRSFNQSQISIHPATKMLDSVTWNNKNVPKWLICRVWETIPYVNDGLEFIRIPFFLQFNANISCCYVWYCGSLHEGLWNALRIGSEGIATRRERLYEIKTFNYGVRMEV